MQCNANEPFARPISIHISQQRGTLSLSLSRSAFLLWLSLAARPSFAARGEWGDLNELAQVLATRLQPSAVRLGLLQLAGRSCAIELQAGRRRAREPVILL